MGDVVFVYSLKNGKLSGKVQEYQPSMNKYVNRVTQLGEKSYRYVSREPNFGDALGKMSKDKYSCDVVTRSLFLLVYRGNDAVNMMGIDTIKFDNYYEIESNIPEGFRKYFKLDEIREKLKGDNGVEYVIVPVNDKNPLGYIK